MFTKIGRKLMAGAKAEMEEKPPAILDQDRWADLLETGLTLGLMMILIFGSSRGSNKLPVTVIVNNYIQKG